MRMAALLLGAALFGGWEAAAYRQIHLLPDPQGRVVAVAVRFPTGSANDPIGGEGTAYLLGRTIERGIADPLAGLGARLEVAVDREEFLLTLLVAPDRWREAVRALESALFDEPVELGVLEEARRGILEVLAFEEGSPVRRFEQERTFLLLGAASPAARPVRGTASSLLSLSSGNLLAFRAEHLRRETGIVAVTGPVEASEVEALFRGTAIPVGLGRSVAPGPAPVAGPPTPVAVGVGADSLAPPLPPAPTMRLSAARTNPLRVSSLPAAPRAWSSGEATAIPQDLTSTWIAIAFPFPADAPPLLLDFLGHLVTEGLNRTPPDPGLYESSATVEWVRDAPVIVISASVDPFRTAEWDARLRGAFDSIAASPPAGAFFDLTRRRFRSALLLELAAPERIVAWIVRGASAGHLPLVDPELEIWRLERESVAEAARAAGPPRTLLFGPQGLGEP